MKYSIIIPCYNEEDNVEKLINLLSSKSNLYDIEWIIVENGSKDNTRDLLKKACENRENFKLVYADKNQGYGYGIAQGLKNVSGDYVGWLHADMQVSPDSMLEFIKINELSKIFADISGIRNDINHAGFRPSPLDAKGFKIKLEKEFKKFKEIWENKNDVTE